MIQINSEDNPRLGNIGATIIEPESWFAIYNEEALQEEIDCNNQDAMEGYFADNVTYTDCSVYWGEYDDISEIYLRLKTDLFNNLDDNECPIVSLYDVDGKGVLGVLTVSDCLENMEFDNELIYRLIHESSDVSVYEDGTHFELNEEFIEMITQC